jgi:peptidoglycan/LPS O-acetylase OafA/YrhL
LSADREGRQRHYVVLEFLRGMAAISVLLFHSRHLLFGEHNVQSHNIPMLAFYTATSLGHQAVIIFFVLSGFFIAKTVQQDIEAKRFSFSEYMVKRCCRLVLVLIPALLATALLDRIGMILTHAPFYSGIEGPTFAPATYHLFSVEPFSLSAFLGNLVFLQTIVVPTFGTDGPLWSLANEFWYYVLFPAVILALVGSSWGVRLRWSGATLFLIVLLPNSILMYGSIWLMGVLIFALKKYCPQLNLPARITVPITMGLVLVSIVGAKWLFGFPFAADLTLGAATALFVYASSGVTRTPQWFNSVAKSTSNFSYSLYLIHLPLFGFLWSVIFHCRHLDFNVDGLGTFAALTTAVAILSYGFHWMFERHTRVVQTFMLRMLPGDPRIADFAVQKSERVQNPGASAS